MQCHVYRSDKKLDTYIYVNEDLQSVPAVLVQQLSPLILSMTLDIQPQRRLAHADAKQVLTALLQQGFYLQLPPAHHYVPIVQFNQPLLT